MVSHLFAAVDFLNFKVGIIHRDIKPSNCLIFEENGKTVLKLCDFGLARLQDKDKSTNVTAVGTIEYMAPELLMARMSNTYDNDDPIVRSISNYITCLFLSEEHILMFRFHGYVH